MNVAQLLIDSAVLVVLVVGVIIARKGDVKLAILVLLMGVLVLSVKNIEPTFKEPDHACVEQAK